MIAINMFTLFRFFITSKYYIGHSWHETHNYWKFLRLQVTWSPVKLCPARIFLWGRKLSLNRRMFQGFDEELTIISGHSSTTPCCLRIFTTRYNPDLVEYTGGKPAKKLPNSFGVVWREDRDISPWVWGGTRPASWSEVRRQESIGPNVLISGLDIQELIEHGRFQNT